MRKRTQYGKIYESTEDMIKSAISFGFHHVGGNGFRCECCRERSSARKFRLDKHMVFACNKCGARYSS